MFPIALASMEDIKTWSSFDADIGKDLAVEVREYFIPDFSNWRDPLVFERQVERVIMGLRGASHSVGGARDTKRRKEICMQLRNFLNEANKVYEQTLALSAEAEQRSNDISYGEERLRRWKARVIKYLDQNISDGEALSFIGKSSTIGSGFPIGLMKT